MSYPKLLTPEERELRIEERTKEILGSSIHALLVDSSSTSISHTWPAYNCFDAVSNIKRENWLSIARSIIKKDYEVLGRLIYLGVIEHLTEEAEYKAENEPF